MSASFVCIACALCQALHDGTMGLSSTRFSGLLSSYPQLPSAACHRSQQRARCEPGDHDV